MTMFDAVIKKLAKPKKKEKPEQGEIVMQLRPHLPKRVNRGKRNKNG